MDGCWTEHEEGPCDCKVIKLSELDEDVAIAVTEKLAHAKATVALERERIERELAQVRRDKEVLAEQEQKLARKRYREIDRKLLADDEPKVEPEVEAVPKNRKLVTVWRD